MSPGMSMRSLRARMLTAHEKRLAAVPLSVGLARF
jgi:hypothetical protein